jgi:hypothetical protein
MFPGALLDRHMILRNTKPVYAMVNQVDHFGRGYNNLAGCGFHEESFPGFQSLDKDGGGDVHDTSFELAPMPVEIND